LPQVRNGLLAISVFTFIRGWEEYIFVFTFLIRNTNWTMSLYMFWVRDDVMGVDYGVVSAVGVFYLVPSLLLYVAAAWHGRGVARALMAAAAAEAERRGAQTLWLGVWERNARAQAFYRKWNFRDVGEHIFQLGADRQRDILMERSLKSSDET